MINEIAGKNELLFRIIEIGGNKFSGRKNEHNNKTKPITNKFLITLGASIPYFNFFIYFECKI